MLSTPSQNESPFRLPNRPLANWLRMLLIFSGLIAIGLLITAACLTPNPRGLGTHQQLGLPPCTMQSLMGIRCPSCGMTTSWAYMARGRIVPAFASNSGGALLAILAAIMGPWSLLSGLRGEWLGGIPNEWSFAIASVGIMIVTLVDWGVRLYLNTGP